MAKKNQTKRDPLIAIQELQELKPNIIFCSEYKGEAKNISCECKICGHKWDCKPHNLRRSAIGCSKCAGNHKKTHKEFVEELYIINPDIKIIGTYVDTNTKIECECLICGYKWETTPGCLLYDKTKCPQCLYNKLSQIHTFTEEQFLSKIAKINPNIKILSPYINKREKIECECKICGHKWNPLAGSVLQGYGCPECAKRHLSTTLSRTSKEYIELIKQINPNIEVLEEYTGCFNKIKHKCLICGYEWDVMPNGIIQGHGCPACAHSGCSYQDERAYEYLSEFYPQARYRDTSLIGIELDIVIPELKIAFEPGSWYFHYNKIERDALKRELCKEKGYTCYTLYDSYPENTPPPFNEKCLVIPWDNGQNKDKYDVILQNLKELWEVTQCQS